MLWKFTFLKLHLPLLSGLKPEAMELAAVCACGPWLGHRPDFSLHGNQEDKDAVGEGGEVGRTLPWQFLGLHRF